MERHLIEDENIRNKFQRNDHLGKTVGIKISKQFARQRNGQLLLWMTCNLIGRLKDIVTKIEICIPDDIEISSPKYLPFRLTESKDLKSNISNALEQCVDCDICYTSVDLSTKSDALVLIGSDTTTNISSKYVQNVTCFDWFACIGKKEKLKNIPQTKNNNPFGAIAASCIIVGDIFKFFNKIDPKYGELIDELCFSTYDLKKYDIGKILELPNPEIDFPINFKKLYICGSGAVAHSFCQTLIALGKCDGDLFFIDRKYDANNNDETIEPTNLARYILATKNDIGSSKAELLSTKMSQMGFNTDFSDDSFEGYIDSINVKLNHVISCVDNNHARHAIQDQLPKLIHGGSVDSLTLQVSIYDMQSDCQCLKCNRPKNNRLNDDDILNRLKKITVNERKKISKSIGINDEQLCEYMKNPQCGILGNDSIQKFSNAFTNPDFSVNFVTTLSGLLLAAEIIKNINNKTMWSLNSNDNTDAYYNFWYNNCVLTITKSKNSCWCNCGDPTPRKLHTKIWHESL